MINSSEQLMLSQSGKNTNSLGVFRKAEMWPKLFRGCVKTTLNWSIFLWGKILEMLLHI